jgi:hypothetical protein
MRRGGLGGRRRREGGRGGKGSVEDDGEIKANECMREGKRMLMCIL